MGKAALASGMQDIDAGVAAARAHRFDQAAVLFFRALQALERIGELPLEREQLASAALILNRCGYPDLALMALQQVLALDVQIGGAGARCADLLTLANTQMGLGRIAACEAANEAALEVALAHERYADAASASTNLAIQYANSGRVPQAFERLDTSLEYLTREELVETEIITRLVLIQLTAATGSDPARAIDAARPLFGRLADHLDPTHWQQAEPALRECIERYVSGHPELDAQAWRRATFPSLYPAQRA